MPETLELVGYTFLAPAAIAIVVVWLCRRLLSEGTSARYALALAVAAGFAAGYALLPDWAPLAPERHWQWLAYLAIAAAVLGAVSVAEGVHLLERWLIYGLLALVAAWQLVPTWDTLQPPRAVFIPALAGYLLVLMAVLAALPARLLGRLFTGLLTGTMLATALLVALEVSLKFGQLGVIAAAALAGCWGCISFTFKSKTDSKMLAVGNRALVPLYVLLSGGLAFVGAIEPEKPLLILLVVPAAPLVLVLFAGFGKGTTADAG